MSRTFKQKSLILKGEVNTWLTFTESGSSVTVTWGSAAWAFSSSMTITGTTSYFRLGTFASATAGSGLVLSASQTAGARFYADDGGAVISAAGSVPDIRGVLSRVLITKDNSSNHWRMHALMGHLKSVNGEWKSEQTSAVHGYLELTQTAGTISLQGYGVTAGLMSTVESSGTMEVETNHVLAGVGVISKLLTGLTVTGKSCGVYIDVYDSTNWSDGSATRLSWTYGVYVKYSTYAFTVGAGGQNGILIDALPGGADGCILKAGTSSARLSMTVAGNMIGSFVNNAATSGSVRNIIAETQLTGTSISTSLYTIRGYAEVGTGCTVAGASYIAGIQGKLKVTGTMNHADSRLCCILAQMDISAGTYTTGQLSALWVDAGATAASAHAGGGQFNMIRITNTTIAVPNAVIYAYATASYFADLSGPGGTAAWLVNAAVGGSQDYKIKIKVHGTDYFIPCNTA